MSSDVLRPTNPHTAFTPRATAASMIFTIQSCLTRRSPSSPTSMLSK